MPRAVACPECGRNAEAIGPYRICRNLDCDTLVVGGRVSSTPWARRALGRDGLDELAALLPPDMVLNIGAGNPGSWTARVLRVPSLAVVGEAHYAGTARSAAEQAIAQARAAA